MQPINYDDVRIRLGAQTIKVDFLAARAARIYLPRQKELLGIGRIQVVVTRTKGKLA